MGACVIHPDDKIHPASLTHVQQTGFFRLGRDLHDPVAVQITAHQPRHIAQGCGVKPFGADLAGRHHLLGILIKMEQHRSQIVARNAGPAVQHQIMFSVGTHASRHRGAARKAVCRKPHHRHLLEGAFLIDSQQFDLHTAVLQGRHQDQVLIAPAGDILHQILLILLLQNGGQFAVFIGVDRQIVVALCGHVAHHQLHRVAGLQLSKADIFHRISQSFHILPHLPRIRAVPLQDRNTDIGAFGCGVKDSGILSAIAVQILQQEGRQQIALQRVFQLSALPQPVVQGCLDVAVITGKPGRTEKFFHLYGFSRHTASCKKQAQQHPEQYAHTAQIFFQLSFLLPVENQPGKPENTLLSVYHAESAIPTPENEKSCAKKCREGGSENRRSSYRERTRPFRAAPASLPPTKRMNAFTTVFREKDRVSSVRIFFKQKNTLPHKMCSSVFQNCFKQSEQIKRAPELPSQQRRRGERRS